MTTFQRGYINLFEFFSATEKKSQTFFLLQKKNCLYSLFVQSILLRNQIKKYFNKLKNVVYSLQKGCSTDRCHY